MKGETIKFRARSVAGELYYFSVLDIEGSDLDESFFYIQDTSEMLVKESLERFTGVTDKNGVEIYEGDIVRDELRDERDPLEVFYCVENAAFMLGHKGERTQYDKRQRLWGEYCTVIGNIHENPDLLAA